jgi:hypothetical protein
VTTNPNEETSASEPPSREELPLPDYDHLPLASVIQRIRSLEEGALQSLLDYEVAHGDRLPVVEAMRTRLGELAAGAEPSGGSVTGPMPERGEAPTSPRRIDQTTDAPPVNPPSQGDPTNPAQPRR